MGRDWGTRGRGHGAWSGVCLDRSRSPSAPLASPPSRVPKAPLAASLTARPLTQFTRTIRAVFISSSRTALLRGLRKAEVRHTKLYYRPLNFPCRKLIRTAFHNSRTAVKFEKARVFIHLRLRGRPLHQYTPLMQRNSLYALIKRGIFARKINTEWFTLSQKVGLSVTLFFRA